MSLSEKVRRDLSGWMDKCITQYSNRKKSGNKGEVTVNNSLSDVIQQLRLA